MLHTRFSPAGLHGLFYNRGYHPGCRSRMSLNASRPRFTCTRSKCFPSRGSRTSSYIGWNHREMARAACPPRPRPSVYLGLNRGYSSTQPVALTHIFNRRHNTRIIRKTHGNSPRRASKSRPKRRPGSCLHSLFKLFGPRAQVPSMAPIPAELGCLYPRRAQSGLPTTLPCWASAPCRVLAKVKPTNGSHHLYG